MSSDAATRENMTPISRRWRAYFAPVDRATCTPAVFDPARDAAFSLDAPPSPWIDAGWIDNVKRTPGTKVATVRAGAKGAAVAQSRSELDARIEFDFRQWGKLQMALAAGSEHMNVLAEAAGAARAPSGGTVASATNVLAGSTSCELVVGASAISFAVGDLVAVDIDYTGQTGYVGTGVASAFVRSGVGLGADYIRRVTLNVSRVVEKTATSLKLSQPLIGGASATNAKVQRVIAFADREGGRFFPEWSALFVLDADSGGRICFYYPRLQPCSAASESPIEVAEPLQAYSLRASFVALPFTDPADGEAVLCWRSYFPDANAPVY